MNPLVRCPVCGAIIDMGSSRTLRNPVILLPPLFAAVVTGIYYLLFHNFIYAVIWGVLSVTEISPWIIIPPIWYGLAAAGLRFFIAYRFIYPPALHWVHLGAEGRGKEAKSIRPQIIIFLILIALLDIPGRLLLKLLGF